MTDSEIRSRVCSIVASVFNVEIGKIDNSSSPDSIEAWDSMGQLTLVMALEQDFDVQFTDRQSAALNDIQSIIATVSEALGDSEKS